MVANLFFFFFNNKTEKFYCPTTTTVQRHLVYVISTSGFVSRNCPFEEKKYLFTLTHTIPKPQIKPQPLLHYQKYQKFCKVCMYITRVYHAAQVMQAEVTAVNNIPVTKSALNC